MQTQQTRVNTIGAWLAKMTGGLRLSGPREPKALSTWLPLVIGGLLGILVASLVLQQNWVALLAILMIVPVLALFFYYPFITVIIWLLIFPFFISEVLPGARQLYWLLHRAMIPGALIALISLSILGIRKIKNVRFGLVDAVMLAYLALCVSNILMLSARPLIVTLSRELGALDGGFDCADAEIIMIMARTVATSADRTILFMIYSLLMRVMPSTADGRHPAGASLIDKSSGR